MRYEPQDYPRVAARIADILLHGIATPGLQPAAATAPLNWNAGADAAVDSATREAYLRAATRLVNQHGYHGASVDRIAAVLQLTKGSFYHHHETKEELIAACFERTFGVMRAAQAAALAAPGSGLDRLALACRALLAFQMSPDGPLLRVTAWTGLPDPLRSETRRTMGRLGERFATLVIDGMDDGSVRVVDPSIAAQVINGMINAAAELERWARGIAPPTCSSSMRCRCSPVCRRPRAQPPHLPDAHQRACRCQDEEAGLGAQPLADQAAAASRRSPRPPAARAR